METLDLKLEEEKLKQKISKKFQTYKLEVEKLEKKFNGVLTPQSIVDEAEKKSSPLHPFFDWDNNSAGPKHRLHQARILLNTIKVKVMFEGGVKEYRKYLNVRLEADEGEKTTRAYIPSQVALTNEDYRQQILQKALNEADYWRRTYEDYTELEGIFKAIGKTKKKLKKVLVNYQ